MMQNLAPIRARKPSEDGYMLLVAMFLLALLVLSLSVAAPRMAKSIQRDREVETMHRGKQYTRAIQLYYRRFHAYPPSVDTLVNTNNIRFLRKKYVDPMTGKDDWKPIMFGQNKTPLAMGFFGQPLGGVAGQPIAGIGPSGGGVPNNGLGSNTGLGIGSGSGQGIGSGSSLFPQSNAGTTDSGQANSTGATGTTGDNSGTSGTTGGTGGTDANGNPTSGSGSSTSGSGGTGFMTGQTGQTLGGGIIGFSPASPKQSILTYKKKNHYNEWEFTYSPLQEMQQQAGGNAGAIGSPVGAGVGGTGTSPSPVGSSPSSGPSPTQPSTPTQSQPQQ